MRKTMAFVAVATGALTVATSAVAQNRSLERHYGYNSGYRYDNGYRPYVRPRDENPRWHEQFEHNRRRDSSRNRNRNAEIAIGAAVVGGILGYALSQSQSGGAPQSTYYPNQYPSNHYGANQGYVTAPVQVQPVQPVYTQPYYQQPQTYYQQPQTYYQQPQQPYYYNGRTYYRSAPQ